MIRPDVPSATERHVALGPALTGGASAVLPFSPPLHAGHLLGFLAARAVPGVEEVEGSRLRRVVGGEVVEVALHPDHVVVATTSGPPSAAVLAAVARLLDLSADPTLTDARLGADPHLASLVAARPGLRSPGHVDGFELAVRAVLGQQVSVAGARTLAGRLVASYGEPLAAPVGALTHAFPTAITLATVDPATLPMPRRRGQALVALAGAVAAGRLDLGAGADPDAAGAGLVALPGIGPWTAGYVRMRAFGDPDVWLPTDLVLRRVLQRRGAGPADVERWRPVRSYALHHLWASTS